MHRRSSHPLTPEEDSIGDADDVADELDDSLPADLWFRRGPRPPRNNALSGKPDPRRARRVYQE